VFGDWAVEYLFDTDSGGCCRGGVQKKGGAWRCVGMVAIFLLDMGVPVESLGRRRVVNSLLAGDMFELLLVMVSFLW